MATPPIEKPRGCMSAATFIDDLMREQQAMFRAMNQNMEEGIKIGTQFENLRQKHNNTLKELDLKNAEIKELRGQNHLTKIHLDTVRKAYTRETTKYDGLMKDFKILAKKVAAVQDLLNEEESNGKPNLERQNSVLSILSSLKLDNYTILEESFQSDDSLMYDKSEESLDMLNETVAKTPKMDNTQTPKLDNTQTPKMDNTQTPKMDNTQTPKNNTSTPKMDHTLTPVETEFRLVPSTSKVNSPQLRKSTVSNFSIYTYRLNAMRKGAKFDNERLDVREHTFHQKKTFKTSTTCGACGKSIGFCASCLICSDCRGVAHATEKCRAMMPKPCLPFTTSNAGLKRMQSYGQVGQVGQMVRLADFAEAGSRPCVPALLIHCCNEIDRRIGEAKKNPNYLTSSLCGLYRDQPAEKEARELRNRILSGNGIPNLSKIEPNVLCSVVKSFLRDLDDPVITQIMWTDFLRVSEHIHKICQDDASLTDSDYESHQDNESNDSSNQEWQEALRVLKGAIVQLPNANRDSLCFIFLHFYRLLDSPTVVKLNVDDLSRAFASTIVGSLHPTAGTSRLSTGDSRRENAKQMMIMSAFFKLSRHFWEGLLKDPNFSPFGPVAESELNRTVFNNSITQNKRRTTINARNLNLKSTSDAIY